MNMDSIFSDNPLCRKLGIIYPVLQAGMGLVARSELAAAVSDAGGLGVIGHASSRLTGSLITTPDIRAGMALLIAALGAHGTSEIQNIQQIDRGYEAMEHRLAALGADIRREKA